MKKILLLLTVLSTLSAYAVTCGNEGEAARMACEQTGGFESMCKRAIGFNHADEAAVAVCSSVVSAPDNLIYSCLKATVNKSFSRGEIKKCMGKRSFHRIDCISNSGVVFIQQDYNQNNGDSAYLACEETGGFESFCKRAVATNHADEGAIKVCLSASHVSDGLKYNCIKASVNKSFSRRELTKCMMKKGFHKVDCISNSGSVLLPNVCI